MLELELEILVWFGLVLVFPDMVLLFSVGYPRSVSAYHAGLELRDLLASACRVLGLKVLSAGWYQHRHHHPARYSHLISSVPLENTKTALYALPHSP